MKEKKISVVMSCYNEEISWIEKSIDSVLNQTYKNFEFIIILDNPTNINLKNKLKEYEKVDSRIVVIENKINKGLIGSLNLALTKSTGYYIARMDADDICYENRLEEQIKAINKDESIDMVVSSAIFIDENNNILKKDGVYDFNNISKALKVTNMVVHPTWLFKKDILKKLKQYEGLEYVEDYNFLCRFELNGFKINYIDKDLIKYRIRENSITRSKRVKQVYNFYLTNKMYKNKRFSADSYYIDKEFKEFKEAYLSFKNLKDEFIKKKSVKTLIKMGYIIIKNNIKRDQIIKNIKTMIFKKTNIWI